MTKKSMIERFEDKYTITGNGCWEWFAASHERGYGYFFTSKEYSSRKMDYAHRVSLFLYEGIRDDTKSVLHSCDNPCCVNPEHLTLGTHKENMEDMIRKKRSISGVQKLSLGDVENIMELRGGGMEVKEIASLYNIDRGHASRVSRGQRVLFNPEG